MPLSSRTPSARNQDLPRLFLTAAWLLMVLLHAAPARAQCGGCVGGLASCGVTGCMTACPTRVTGLPVAAPSHATPPAKAAPAAVMALASSGKAEGDGAAVESVLYNLGQTSLTLDGVALRYQCGDLTQEERPLTTAITVEAGGSLFLPSHRGVCALSRGEVTAVSLWQRAGVPKVLAQARIYIPPAPPPLPAPGNDDVTPAPQAGGDGVAGVVRVSTLAPPQPPVEGQRY